MKFLEYPTRNLCFTGKGGVGQTSVACATAVRLADAGQRVLLVSPDPVSNLDEVLGVALGYHPTPIPAVPGLAAMDLDPEKAAVEYRERAVGPWRGLHPKEAVASMEEQFSGSCMLEIAAFDEFSRLLGAAALQRDLRRAEIEPYAWVINQSLAPLAVTDPLLQGRQAHEWRYIAEVVEQRAMRTVLIVWQLAPPVGRDALRQLVEIESPARKAGAT